MSGSYVAMVTNKLKYNMTLFTYKNPQKGKNA